MKKFHRTLLTGLAFILVIHTLPAQSDIESAQNSVVKITTNFSVRDKATGRLNPGIGTATGFCWKDPMYVVTALHSVAGVDRITVSRHDGRQTLATIFSVLLEADLALLKLHSDLALVPLHLKSVDPNIAENFIIWGYPHAVFKMQDHEVRLSRSLDARPILDHIIPSQLKHELQKQTYPSLQANILKISSIIQPGQSGAPLLTPDGKVVGIADGGLRGGTALINWAMPAEIYVPRLAESADPIPRVRSIQSSMFSSSTTIVSGSGPVQKNYKAIHQVNQSFDSGEEPQLFHEAEVLQLEAAENTVYDGERFITKTWTAGFDDIVATMDRDEILELEELVEAFGLSLDDMRDTYYDIYEDFETGATISIPFGEEFSVENGLFYTCNTSQSLCYFVYSLQSDNYQDALILAHELFDASLPGGDWNVDPNDPDLVEEDSEYEEAGYVFTRYSPDGEVFEYVVDIEGTDMLVAFLTYNINDFERTAFLKEFLHFYLALEMRDFAEF